MVAIAFTLYIYRYLAQNMGAFCCVPQHEDREAFINTGPLEMTWFDQIKDENGDIIRTHIQITFAIRFKFFQDYHRCQITIPKIRT